MSFRHGALIIFVFLLCVSSLIAQEEKEKKWSLNGYLKDLQSVSHSTTPKFTFTDNLVHNRLNFKWFPNENWLFKTEIRTRIFWGETVKFTPNFADLLNDANNDIWDFSLIVFDSDAAAMHTMIDRLSLEFIKGNFEARIGRQRINWGQNLIWNPLDWFNAYSFQDFDYEERPGSDALRVQYFTGVASSIEIVSKSYTERENYVGGIRWIFNKWGYDFQLQTGFVEGDIGAGLGWAGHLGGAGFKGEFSIFPPGKMSATEQTIYAFATEFDYTFKNSLYFNLSFLYTSSGSVDGNIFEILTAELNAKNLYPFRYSFMNQLVYPVSPLINLVLLTVYSPGESNAVFLNPAFTYSIASNWDLDSVFQLAFANDGEKYTAPFQLFFLRLKFSF